MTRYNVFVFSSEEEEEDDHFEEEEEEMAGLDASDHEFSPESSIDDDDEDYQPVKRARTAHSSEFTILKVGPEYSMWTRDLLSFVVFCVKLSG